MKVKILVACHKPELVYHDSVYTPIHVGRAISNYKEEMSDMLGDDTGDNISKKNPMYCEMTAQYWAWKNIHDVEFIGFCHYRRFFDIFIVNSNIEKILKNKDVVLIGSRRWHSVERGLGLTISLEDITIFLMVLKKMYPDYEKDVLTYLKSNWAPSKNMLICRKELFDQYAEWIFSLLFECEKYIRLSPYTRGRRVFAYLAEYFMPIYFIHNHYRIREASYGIEPKCFFKKRIRSIAGRFFKKGINFMTNCYKHKNQTFEDYYQQAVLVGLKMDGII